MDFTKPTESIMLYCDEARLREVITIILENSFNRTPRDGQISVEARERRGDVAVKGEKSYNDHNKKALVRLAGCKGCMFACLWNGRVAIEPGKMDLFDDDDGVYKTEARIII